MSTGVENILNISTSHVSYQTMQNFKQFLVAEYEYGGVYWIPETPDSDIVTELLAGQEIPEDFMRLIQYAKSHNCAYMILDSSGEVLDFLPVYDW